MDLTRMKEGLVLKHLCTKTHIYLYTLLTTVILDEYDKESLALLSFYTFIL